MKIYKQWKEVSGLEFLVFLLWQEIVKNQKGGRRYET